jgi:hypothetical protein
MVIIIVGVDVLLLQHLFWLRLTVNVVVFVTVTCGS